MNKVWIFGDSYAEIQDAFGPNQWQLLLGKDLDYEIHNVSENGASCAWLLLKWHELLEKFNSSDKIILMVPFSGRSLIFKNDPGLSSGTCLDLIGKEKRISNKWKAYNKDQIDAFKKYFMYIHDDAINLSIAFALVNTINNCATLFDTPPLIISTNEEQLPVSLLYNCVLAKGSTIHINTEEFESKKLWNKVAGHGMFLDHRICHMSEVNHIIFAEKIKEYFTKGSIPDLTQGFYKNIILENDIAFK